MTTLAVEASSITCRYAGADLPALDDVSLAVRSGEVIGLLGPNGSGKSTLFRTLASLLRPTSGTLRIFGHDAVADPAAARRMLGVVFQSPALDRELTAAENLAYHGRLLGLGRGEAKRRAAELLDAVELADKADEVAKRLSGGMRRRLEIARALLDAPPLLLMDEPTVGLDPAARRATWALVRRLREAAPRPPAVLVSTHLMADLDADAAGPDRLVLLDRGRVVADAPPQELRGRSSEEYVTLWPADPADADRLASWVEGKLRRSVPPPEHGRLRIGSASGTSELSTLLGDTPPVALREATVGRATLEDVYLDLTGRPLASA